MTWNNKVNNWVPIGGHVGVNELPCDSVVREAKEESGLNVQLVSPKTASKQDNLPQPFHVHLDKVKEDHFHINLTYFARIVSGECFEKDDEGKELKWFSKEDIETEKFFPHLKDYAIEAISFFEVVPEQ